MSKSSSLNTLDKAAESLFYWNDMTRVTFDNQYTEAIRRKVQAYEHALEELEKSIREVERIMDRVDGR